MLNSLSAYHSGQGGGATCFISLPEYPTPAKAAEVTRAVPSRHNSSFFIDFSFWLSPPNLARRGGKSTFAACLDAVSLSRSGQICKLFRAVRRASGLQFRPGICVGNDEFFVVKCGVPP